MSKDFDEGIVDNEKEFKKRFKRIGRPPFVDKLKNSKETKSRITIYLDADIIEYFKVQAEKTNLGYQTLINQALREKIYGSQTDTTADEVIEKILNDKAVLSRLKTELEEV